MYDGVFGLFNLKYSSTTFVVPALFLVVEDRSDKFFCDLLIKYLQKDSLLESLSKKHGPDTLKLIKGQIFRKSMGTGIDKMTLSSFSGTPTYLITEVCQMSPSRQDQRYFIGSSDKLWNDRIIHYAIGPSLTTIQPYLQQWIKHPLYVLFQRVFGDTGAEELVRLGKKRNTFVSEISLIYLNNQETRETFTIQSGYQIDTSACISSATFGHEHTKDCIAGITEDECRYVSVLHDVLSQNTSRKRVQCVILGNEYMTVSRMEDLLNFKDISLSDDNKAVYILLQEFFESKVRGLAYIPLIKICPGDDHSIRMSPQYLTGVQLEDTEGKYVQRYDTAEMNIWRLLHI